MLSSNSRTFEWRISRMFREIALELDKAHLRVQNDIDNIPLPGQASEVANDMLIATMLKER